MFDFEEQIVITLIWLIKLCLLSNKLAQVSDIQVRILKDALLGSFLPKISTFPFPFCPKS